MTEISKSKKKKINRPLAQLLSAHAIGAEGLGFKSRVGLVGTVSRTARHRCDVFRSCVAQALSHGDGPRHQGMLWNGMEDDFSIFHTAKFLPFHTKNLPFHIPFHTKFFFHISFHSSILMYSGVARNFKRRGP